jgi:hypothetical protein
LPAQPSLQPRQLPESPQHKSNSEPPAVESRSSAEQADDEQRQLDAKDGDLKSKAAARKTEKGSPPEAAPRPIQRIFIDVSAKKQREILTLKGPVRVARVDGSKHSIAPREGVITARPVEVQLLDGPRPILLSVSLLERDGEYFIIIEPTIETDSKDRIPFTIGELKKVRLSLIKSWKAAVKDVEKLSAELAYLQGVLNPRIAPPALEFKRAYARAPVVENLIPEAQARVAQLEVEVQATEDLTRWAQRLESTCCLVIEEFDPENP